MEKDKPPILGLIQRGGQVVLHMLANVQQGTIKPVITAAVAPGTLIHTDEYSIYARLPACGHGHKTVYHARGEYARDEDGDGFCEVHVNTMEGFWLLLRSWLRPHRGISQDKLPDYLGFFQFVHNARRRGKALLATLVAALVHDPAYHPGTRQEPSLIAPKVTERECPLWPWPSVACMVGFTSVRQVGRRRLNRRRTLPG